MADRFVGLFEFAKTKADIYRKPDGSLYIKLSKGNLKITLCADGKIVIGKAPPVEITPSLKDVLKHM